MSSQDRPLPAAATFPRKWRKDSKLNVARVSFPCEAGEGAEGGWGQSWLATYNVLRWVQTGFPNGSFLNERGASCFVNVNTPERTTRVSTMSTSVVWFGST
jgi:hypothetical protein